MIAVAILWIVWFLVVYGRIYLGEHSLPQVLVGVCVGLAYGLFWYYLDITVPFLVGFNLVFPFPVP